MNEVYIVSAKRTPVGTFLGGLNNLTAPQLGAQAIKAALENINLPADKVDEVILGNVLQANVGQAPAKQAATFAGIPQETSAVTVNKVCASGMKAIIMATQSILLGDNEIVVAGGMESMSNVPHYMDKGRNGGKFGDMTLTDGLIKDGLTNVYDQTHMGNCAEKCASDYKITREEQDNFSLDSYKKATEAWKNGKFTAEVTPVEIPQRRGDALIVKEDEQYTKVRPDKMPQLRPAFQKDGSVTAGNASPLSDGASALVLMNKEKVEELGLKPLAKIIAYADASKDSVDFTTAPEKAINKALKKANLSTNDIDFWELNEAFAVVGIANIKLLNIAPDKVNVYGGAVALGHPLGNSGSRIATTLTHILQQENGRYGVAGICNGGGGASALVIEKV